MKRKIRTDKKKGTYMDPYKDYVYNNPRADRQIGSMDAQIDDETMSKMLYDDKKKDLINRMSDAYQKRKRKKKIEKLSRISTHWKGLEDYDLNSQYDDISSTLQSLRFSNTRPRTYRDYAREVDLRVRGVI